MQGLEYKNQVSAARIYMHVLYSVEWSLEAQEHYFPEYCFISMAENWTAYSEKSTNVFHWNGKVVRVSALSSHETLKESFKASSEYQDGHLDDLSVSML